MTLFLRVLVVLSAALTAIACTTDHGCSLNGVCHHDRCVCDPGWIGTDCGVLDLREAKPSSGYNLTGSGTSSWGGHIVQDPHNDRLFHLIASEFIHGCGLSDWIPYSRIIRAESTTGPQGPYTFAAEVVGTFAHNPTVIYSPADKLYLLYHIGCPHAVPSGCNGTGFSCGTGYGSPVSGITANSSPDLKAWTSHGKIMNGAGNSAWDSVVTNPSAFALYSDSDHTSEIILAYRGKSNGGNSSNEHNAITSASSYEGTYPPASGPLFPSADEDPFIWRDKRGNFHMLMHALGEAPYVGRHAFATSWNGTWTYGSTVSYTTAVKFTNGKTISYSRRERPQLYFSTDGKMTPLFMANGVQEVNATDSYSIIVPIGRGAADYEKSLGF